MLIRRLGILCYLLLPPSKVVAAFKELVRLLTLWFLQRNSANVFYQLSFLQTREKRNKLLFLFMALIWNRHLCEQSFILSLNKTWCKHENMFFTGTKQGSVTTGDWESSWCAARESWGMNQGAESSSLPEGAVCAGCLSWPSWDRAWRGLLCSLSCQSSPCCWASETEKSRVKLHSILKNYLRLPPYFLTCASSCPFLPHLFSKIPPEADWSFPVHNWWTACRSLSWEPQRTQVALISTLSVSMPGYFFLPCYFSFQSAEYVAGIWQACLQKLRSRVKDKAYWQCHHVGLELNVFQLELLHNCVPSQPCEVVNHC